MNILIFLFLLLKNIQCISSPDEEIQLKKYQIQCVLETKVDPDLVLLLKTDHWEKSPTELREWCLCMLKKYDLMSAEGVFRIDSAMARIPNYDQEKMLKLIDECLPQEHIEAYDIAWDFIKCYHKKSKEHKYKNDKLYYLYIV